MVEAENGGGLSLMANQPRSTAAPGRPAIAGCGKWRRRAALGLLVLIVLGVAAIRFRLQDMPLERDEGEYAYAGQLMLDGIPPYKLAYNMKFPGTYAAYALIMAVFGETASGIHLGYLLVNAAAIVMVYLLGARLSGRGAGLIASGLYACFTLSREVLGTSAHATHFVMFAVLPGLLLLLRGVKGGSRQALFWSGVCLGAGVLMKQHGAVFSLFALCWLVGARWQADGGRQLAVRILLLAGGIATPLVTTGLWLWHAGVFGKFWFWTIQYARQYVTEQSDISDIMHRFLVYTPRFVYPCLCIALGTVVMFWRRGERRMAWYAAGWLAASVAGVCAGFFFRPHYYVLLLPAVTVLTGLGVGEFRRFCAGKGRPLLGAVPVALLAFMALLNVYRDRVLYFEAPPDDASKRVYPLNPFVEARPIADYIRAHTAGDARVAVIGSEPEIYFYAHRVSATGYLYTIAMMEPQPYARHMQEEMASEIESNRPEYVMWVQCPDSWGVRSNSTLDVVYWAQNYIQSQYEQVGVAEVLTNRQSDIRWDAAAKGYEPTANVYVQVFKRKSGGQNSSAFDRPMIAPPSTSHAELIRQRSRSTADAKASATVSQSTRAAAPSCHVTTAMSASDATLTPFRNAPAMGDARSRGTSGPLNATKTKDGRKMPTVATSAAQGPPST
jgi:hypothetical protein